MSQRVLAAWVMTAALLSTGTALAAEAAFPEHWQAVKVRGYDAAHQAPDAKLSGYDSLYVEAVALEFDEHWQRDMRSRLPARDAERLRADYSELVQQALAEQLSQATGLPRVDTPTTQTLVVRPALTRFRLTAPDLPSDPIKVSFVDFVGAAQLTVELVAGTDGEPVARFSDYSRTRSFGGMDDLKQTNRLVNRRDFRFLAERWGERLGRYLARQAG